MKQFNTFVDMRIKDDIKAKAKDFGDLCKSHKVKYLYAFGSSTTEKFNSKTSDIDLVVEIDSLDPLERGEKLIDLWDKFENFFNRKVDLLTDSSIKNPILRKSIDSTKILIYDGTGQEVLI
jgi:predicted nucleotidyltransferase